MSEELKPCPFCGSMHIVDDDAPGTFGESLVRYAAKCNGCGVSFWHPECDPHRNWNTRPIEDALRKRVEELEEAVKQLEHESGGYFSAAGAAEAKLARVKEWRAQRELSKIQTGDLDAILSDTTDDDD